MLVVQILSASSWWPSERLVDTNQNIKQASSVKKLKETLIENIYDGIYRRLRESISSVRVTTRNQMKPLIPEYIISCESCIACNQYLSAYVSWISLAL